jgi:hypothetical protein
VHAGEVTGLARIVANAIVEVGVDLVRLPLQRFGAIFSKLGDRRLGRVCTADEALGDCLEGGTPSARAAGALR